MCPSSSISQGGVGHDHRVGHPLLGGFAHPLLCRAPHEGDMPSPGSCRVAPGKPRLPQPFQASPGDTAPHDPETPGRTPERHEGGEQASTWSRIQQSVHNDGQMIPMYLPDAIPVGTCLGPWRQHPRDARRYFCISLNTVSNEIAPPKTS